MQTDEQSDPSPTPRNRSLRYGRSQLPLSWRRAVDVVEKVDATNDEWAWRKGTTFGTVIVDLERRQVVELLSDRSAATTADWLKRHPESYQP
jgi:transposase